MFNATIPKEIQTEQNARRNTVSSDIITRAHSSFAANEYEVSDCKTGVSFIFEVIFLNIFIASSMFNICSIPGNNLQFF